MSGPTRRVASTRGEFAIDRLLGWSSWIHVRSESVEWISATTTHWNVAVEFSPQRFRDEPADLRTLDLPLAMLDKETVERRPTVRNESGDRVPTLSIANANERSVEMVIGITALGNRDWNPGDALVDHFRSIVEAPPAKAKAQLAALADCGHDIPKNAMWLLEVLARGHLLFVTVEAGSAIRNIATFEYSMHLPGPPVGIGAIGEKLGWTRATRTLSTAAVAQAASYEIAVAAPEGAAISKAEMSVSPSDWEPSMSATNHAAPRIAGEFLGPGRRRAVRISVKGAPTNALGVLRVEVSPDWAYPAVVLVTAVFAACLLTVGWLNLDVVRDETEAAVALLLAGPTLFAALVSRVGRAGPAAQFLVAARVVLLLSGLLTFIAAGSLVAADSESRQESLWAVLVALAWLTCIVLLFAVRHAARDA